MESDVRKSFYSDLASRMEILEKLHAHFDKDTISLKELNAFCENKKNSVEQFPYFILRERKVGRGEFNIVPKNVGCITPAAPKQVEEVPVAAAAMVAQVVNIASRRAQNLTESFVPDRNETYVPFGFYNDLRDIIKSQIFYPIYITGLSGNGKTFMIEQVCAALKRELIRVNITKRTDESDLIGSYELVDGNTVRREGPVITAMRRGAVLLLDECDLGTEDILCLQPILEGKPYFDKKTGEVVHPAAGFNVIATANTKGKGSDDGRFIGTNLLNEAFLERFAITVEQEYPPAATERKILEKNFAVLNITDTTFIDRLITWAEVIRKSFSDGAVDEVISTRRLVHITKAFSIFNNRLKAIEMCLNRFDGDTKTAFLDLYTKVDAEATPAPVVSEATTTTARPDELVVSRDPSTLTTTFSYKGESVTFSELEIEELRNQGLSSEQIKLRIISTLEKVAVRRSNGGAF
jgi:MoxR-like ATPase